MFAELLGLNHRHMQIFSIRFPACPQYMLKSTAVRTDPSGSPFCKCLTLLILSLIATWHILPLNIPFSNQAYFLSGVTLKNLYSRSCLHTVSYEAALLFLLFLIRSIFVFSFKRHCDGYLKFAYYSSLIITYNLNIKATHYFLHAIILYVTCFFLQNMKIALISLVINNF